MKKVKIKGNLLRHVFRNPKNPNLLHKILKGKTGVSLVISFFVPLPEFLS